MKKLILVLTFPILIIFLLFQVKAEEHARDKESGRGIMSVSILELVTAPEKFHKQEIIVVGVYRNGLAGGSLFPSKEYLEKDVFQSSVSLDWPKNVRLEEAEALIALDGQFVRVTGTFDAELRGYMGYDKGTIVNVIEITKHSR